MVVFLFIWIHQVSATACLANTSSVALGDTITMVVDQKAQFPGGDQALYQHIAKHLKYPKAALEKGIEGTVYLQFIVEKNGTLSNIEVIRSDSPELNQSAIDALEALPKWIPAKVKGEPVRTIQVLPVLFRLSR